MTSTPSYVCVTSHGVFGPFNNPDVASQWLYDTFPDDHRRGPDDHRGVYELQRPPNLPDLCIAGADLRNAAEAVVFRPPGEHSHTVDGVAFAWLEASVRSDA